MKTIERRALEIPELERLEPIHTQGLQRVFAALRLVAGWTFLWAFLDKAFALGFSTGRVLNDAGQTVKIDFFGPDAWIHGASPTAGAVGFALKGPFADNIQSITNFQMTQAGPQVAQSECALARAAGGNAHPRGGRLEAGQRRGHHSGRSAARDQGSNRNGQYRGSGCALSRRPVVNWDSRTEHEEVITDAVFRV